MLWFEHDLYDQLQLLQILAGLPDRPVGVELICVGSFPGRPGFAGLGELEPDELASLWPVRAPVVDEHVRAARAAWDVFRAPDPRGIARAATAPDERLPFVAPALRRLLEELPGARDGLSRTERQLLAAVAAGARTREQAFVAAAAKEEAPFLGDDDRVRAPRGARSRAAPARHGRRALALTDAGADVLAGRADRVALSASTAGSAACTCAPATGCGAGTRERGALVEP